MNAPLGPGGTQGPEIPREEPLYPDTPWWASLIAVLVTAVVSVIGTAYALGGIRAPTPGSGGIPPIASLAIDTVTYMPHILLLFGVLADMFTYDGVWSIPSLIGLLSIFFNYFMQYFWKGLQEIFSAAKNVAKVGSNAPTAPVGGAVAPGSFFNRYDGCSVQGLEGWRTDFAPQTLVITATVFCYYIFDLVRNRGWINSTGAITFFGIVYIFQVGIIQMASADGSCGGPYGHYAQALMALFEGMVFGGSAYGIVQTYYPSRLPSSVMSVLPIKMASELELGPDGRMYDKNRNAYVILPNGQAVPDFSDENTKATFARIAGKNLGTGLPAKDPSCPNA